MTDRELLETLVSEFKKLSAQVGGLTVQVDGLSTLPAQVDGLTTQVGGLTTRMDGLTTQVDGLTSQVDGLTTRMDGLTSQVDGLTSQMDMVSAEVGSLRTDMDSVKANMATRHDIVRLEGKMDENDKALFDGYKLTYEKVTGIEKEVAEINGKIEKQDVEIRVIKGKSSGKRKSNTSL